MANPLPLQNGTIQATSNPQTNLNAVNQANNNGISPITIPIQIQPQIATTPQVQTDVQPNSNLQINNNQNFQAPTPQQYQAPQNNNTVDFNQIYSQYQSRYGTNPANNVNNNTNYSGIKKTSIGTTIVTPTTNNINSIEGQYQSAYSDTINSVISELLTHRPQDFQYNPAEDNALKVASEYAVNSTLSSLAGTGVLNSTATAERVAQVVSQLIPTYENQAYDRYIQGLNYLADTAQLVMNFDSQQFSYWKDAKDREFENKQFEYKKQQDSLNNAWKRVDELGYVDNNASSVLGVAVGTLSRNAREAKEQREYELNKMREQLEIQHQNDLAITRLRADLEAEQSAIAFARQKELNAIEYAQQKELNAQNYERQKSMADYEYQLQQKYGTSKSGTSNKSSVSLSTYKDIINNRYADYDDVSKKHTIPDGDKASVYDYIRNEYIEGRISQEDASSLIALYGLDTNIKMIGNNTLYVKKDGQAYTLKITDGTSKDKILQWGKNIGVDLSSYV